MVEAQITVYGAYWRPDCRRSKQFLGEHQIPYHWVDIEQDPAAEQFVIERDGIQTQAIAGASQPDRPTRDPTGGRRLHFHRSYAEYRFSGR